MWLYLFTRRSIKKLEEYFFLSLDAAQQICIAH